MNENGSGKEEEREGERGEIPSPAVTTQPWNPVYAMDCCRLN